MANFVQTSTSSMTRSILVTEEKKRQRQGQLGKKKVTWDLRNENSYFPMVGTSPTESSPIMASQKITPTRENLFTFTPNLNRDCYLGDSGS